MKAGAAAGSDNSVKVIFKDMEKALSPSLVAKIGGIFKFNLTGNRKFF